MLDTKLYLDKQFDDVIARANRTLRHIIRSSKIFNDPLCLKSLYCCLVRPLIEYASVAWFPEQVTRIERL